MFEWLLAAGLCLFVAGIAQFLASWMRVRTWQFATATVVAIRISKDNDDSPAYQPIFRYTAEDGKSYTYTRYATGPLQHWHERDEMMLLYHPQYPETDQSAIVISAYLA